MPVQAATEMYTLTQVAERSSVNRPRGAPVWKNIKVNRDVYREMLTDNVLPAVACNWPTAEWNDDNRIIKVQQDGASCHLDVNKGDDIFDGALEDLGLQQKIKLITQPANSPDTNINDLGFFNSLDAKYYLESPTTALEIIEMVTKAFDQYDSATLNKIWLTHQTCMNEIIKYDGDNTYKIPHMNKDQLIVSC